MRKNFKEERLNETRMQNCGMNATVTEYLNCKDITVVFEDGTKVEHRSYVDFKRGRIDNPNQYASRLGETRMQNCGMNATVTEYLNCNDITVVFEDGTKVEHRTYTEFKRGGIDNPNQYASRLGETRMQNCGMNATITEYLNYKDITVVFEDGTKVEHRTYGNFKKGGIIYPSINKKGNGILYGFSVKRAYAEEDKVYYNCICSKCGLEDILTPQQMSEHVCSES